MGLDSAISTLNVDEPPVRQLIRPHQPRPQPQQLHLLVGVSRNVFDEVPLQRKDKILCRYRREVFQQGREG